MKIALIGSAPSSVHLAPFKDASFDHYLGSKPAPQRRGVKANPGAREGGYEGYHSR